MYNIVSRCIRVGDIMPNPQRGVSIIVAITPDKIVYRRGKSEINYPFSAMRQTYQAFKGKTVSTGDLRKFLPEIYTSQKSGHSCNAPFFLMVMTACGLTNGPIQGRGHAFYPYYIELKNDDIVQQPEIQQDTQTQEESTAPEKN